MTALDNLHTFSTSMQVDGTAIIEIFRRIELHEVRKVSTFLLFDKASDFAVIGEKFCQTLDLELAQRIHATAKA